MVDEHLNWKTHINNIEKKIAKNIGILSKVAYLLPANVLKNLYYTLIYPYLAYCNVCWASTYPTSLDRLFKLQKRAVRVITKSSFIAHTSPLFQQLKIFNLDQIRQYQTGIFMYRANHNLLPAIFQNYFINIKDIHQHFTRGSDALFLTVVRTNYRKHSIRFMGPVLWNELPKPIRDVSNLSSFKKGLCKYLLDK